MQIQLKTSKEKFNIFKETPIYMGVSVILLILLILSIGFAVTLGSVDISIKEVYKIIFNKLFVLSGNDTINSGPVHDVVWLIRLPRIILALSVGMGLSVVGIVMQAIVKNPLADPYILGISSGASLGATMAIMLGVGAIFGSNSIGIAGFLGALIVSILVLVIANIGGRANSVKLLLGGMALSSICSAFSSFIVYFANDAQGMQKITFWLMIGMLVYSSGMIGFVGLIIPHIVRMIFGTDHKKIIPIAAISGGIFLIWADVLSRTLIDGTEIPIGILISMVGAPCFIWLMIKKTYGFGGKN